MTIYLCTYDDVREDHMADETTKPERPTRAAMDDLQNRLDRALSALGRRDEEVEALARDRDEWRAARAPDGEAEALAGCVRAIEAMYSSDRNPNASGIMPTRSRVHGGHAPASETAVGRVLLHLAGRFGVQLQEVPSPEPDPDTARVPRHLAEELLRLGEALRFSP